MKNTLLKWRTGSRIGISDRPSVGLLTGTLVDLLPAVFVALRTTFFFKLDSFDTQFVSGAWRMTKKR